MVQIRIPAVPECNLNLAGCQDIPAQFVLCSIWWAAVVHGAQGSTIGQGTWTIMWSRKLACNMAPTLWSRTVRDQSVGTKWWSIIWDLQGVLVSSPADDRAARNMMIPTTLRVDFCVVHGNGSLV